MGRKDIRLSPGREAALRLMRQVHRFRRDEQGSLIVFALVLFMLMVMAGGLAVDVMRFETTRTALQQALDRCTLTAASLTQNLTPREVVEDCMEKADKAEYVTSIVVEESLNSRAVTATAVAATNPFFLHLMGIEDLDAPAATKAEQHISNVEISLVLDVSRSMIESKDSRGNTIYDDSLDGLKLDNLKGAAKKFVTKVLKSGGTDLVSISLVPYNGQVNLGKSLRKQYNYTHDHGVADVNCFDMPASGYDSTSLSTSLLLPMTVYGDLYSGSSTKTPDNYNRWCQAEPKNTVLVFSNSETDLHTQIDGLVGIGATSINAGMKWGMTLLDPGTQPVISSLVGAGSPFANRPAPYDDKETLKVIVLMTDGSHFAETRMVDKYRTGQSPIYKAADGKLSIYHSWRTEAKKYWVQGTGTGTGWQSAAYKSGSTNPVVLNWQDVWKNYTLQWIFKELYSNAGAKNSDGTKMDLDDFRTTTGTGTMDTQLKNLCDVAKSKRNVVIYGVAFEAPTEGKSVIRYCASEEKPAHYYEPKKDEIGIVFDKIASQISFLRLTQ